jgi:hypothetical protein
VISEPLCRVPQYINPDSSTKSVPVGSESPKATKPPTPNAEDIVQESMKPMSPGATQKSLSAGGASSLSP